MTATKTSDSSKISSVFGRESNGNIQITFTVPFSIIKKAQDETVAEMAKDIEVSGFRKGMAPLEKVREKISASHLIEHSLSHILPVALADSIKEHKLKIAIYPKFELISADSDKPWQIKAITCELPEFSLGAYKTFIPGEIRAISIKKDPTREEKENAVIKALLENVKMDIPQILIEDEANSRLSTLLSRLEKLGLSLEGYLSSIGKKAEDLRADYAVQAKDAIALDLILSKVSEELNTKVEPKEVDEALKTSQASTNVEISERDLENRKRTVESILKRRKALDSLINLS